MLYAFLLFFIRGGVGGRGDESFPPFIRAYLFFGEMLSSALERRKEKKGTMEQGDLRGGVLLLIAQLVWGFF